MNWFQKIADKLKPMPLPFPVPMEEYETWEGAETIDSMMSEPAAETLKQKYPGVEYLGAGSFGVAGKWEDKAIKLTDDEEEVRAAQALINKNIPCKGLVLLEV